MKLVAAGRDCDVYDHGEGLVLRRYRDGRDARAEARLLGDLEALGYPVPRLVSAAGPDMVMARVVGRTLLEAVGSKSLDPSAGGALLARLHRQLHDLTRVDDEALLHLDFHPANVLLGEDGPVVVDWCNARRGPPGLDLAMTTLILAQVVVTPGMVSSDPTEDAAARAAAPGLLTAYASGVSDDLVEHLEHAASLRGRDKNQSASEAARLPEAVDLVRSHVSRHVVARRRDTPCEPSRPTTGRKT